SRRSAGRSIRVRKRSCRMLGRTIAQSGSRSGGACVASKGVRSASAEVPEDGIAAFELERDAQQAARMFRFVAARIVEDVDFRAVLLRDFAHDGESEAAAFRGAAQDAVEAFEYMRAFGG